MFSLQLVFLNRRKKTILLKSRQQFRYTTDCIFPLLPAVPAQICARAQPNTTQESSNKAGGPEQRQAIPFLLSRPRSTTLTLCVSLAFLSVRRRLGDRHRHRPPPGLPRCHPFPAAATIGRTAPHFVTSSSVTVPHQVCPLPSFPFLPFRSPAPQALSYLNPDLIQLQVVYT